MRLTCLVATLLCAEEAVEAAKRKAPFKMIFSNDFTNTQNCTSPYRKKGELWRPEMLAGSVDETAGTGVDVHMLQPAHTWVPWWPSRVYSMQEHGRWWKEFFGVDQKEDEWKIIHPVHKYLLEGGDPMKVFVARCRQKKLPPFISVRLNDAHHLGYVTKPKNTRGIHAICRFYAEHPEYRLGGPGSVQNWAIPEVRAYKFALIEELCENYDIDGLELDFMRHPQFFRTKETTSDERVKIITDFVTDVRKLLDRTTKEGRHRWLCVRVPCALAGHDAIGVNLVRMVAAGVEMINLSPSYFTVQQTDLPTVTKMVPDAAVYLEMCHCTMQGRVMGPGAGDIRQYTRTTDNQYYTAAHLAYSRGADGVSLFNFVYYREHGVTARGPFNEPPFHICKHLGDPEWLARQPQWYVLTKNWHGRFEGGFKKGQTHTYTLDMAPTEHQTKQGLFRLMTTGDSSACQWTVKLNDTRLSPTEFVRKPLEHPYEAGLGQPSQYACFACPRALVADGPNRITITLDEGDGATVQYIDLVLP